VKTFLIVLAVVAVIAFVAVGFLIFPPDRAAISVAAEPIGLGPVNNAMLTSFVLSAGFLVFAFVVGRRLQELPGGVQNVVESVIEGLDKLVKDAAPAKWAETFFPIVATIFLYLIVINMFSLLTPFLGSIGPAHTTVEGGISPDERKFGIPRVLLIGGEFEDLEPLHHPGDHGSTTVAVDHHEDHVVIVPFLRAPSSDLNMTLALSLITVLLAQWFGLRTHGARYLSNFMPLGGLRRKGFGMWVIELFVGVLEGIGELARIISFSFRLFGNVFAGEVLLIVISSLVPLGLVVVFFGLEIFVGLIQAIVFFLLALVFFSIATAEHEH
jgi:F-type H+-transporting ATPase subunit a